MHSVCLYMVANAFQVNKIAVLLSLRADHHSKLIMTMFMHSVIADLDIYGQSCEIMVVMMVSAI